MLDVEVEPGLGERCFSFGDVPITFESSDRRWLSYLDQRYGGFREARRGPCFTIRFEPTTPVLSRDIESPLAVHLEALAWEATRRGFRVETATSRCDVDLVVRRARLEGPPAMYPLDNVLRHLLPLLFEEGLHVHAAALELDGRGVLACGPSGAGKSTLARLASPHALCDELAAVRDGEPDKTIVSLPFWASRPGRAALRAILFLGHGEEHRLEPLPPELSLRRLASQVLWPVWDESSMERTFVQLASLVREIPAFAFDFAPRPDAWELIAKEVL